MDKKNNDKNKKTKNKKSSAKNCLSMSSQVRTLAIKCYAEQVPKGLEQLKKNISKIDDNYYEVMAIIHDKDANADDIWEPSTEKPHIHIIFRCCGNIRLRVSQILLMLGIVYRPDEDENLWKNHGVETVKNFSKYSCYLTHDTEEAANDGKFQYDLEEIISNLSNGRISDIRNEYLVDVSKNTDKYSLEKLDKEAYELGFNLQDFDDWYDALSFEIRSHTKMKTIHESYTRGVMKRIRTNNEVIRLCVYIQGSPNSGKTYTTKKTLPEKTLVVSGGG